MALEVVGSATSEGEAKLWLDESPNGWDIAIVDLVLQAGSGFGVIPHAAAANRTGKIVVFSGYVSPGVEKYCKDLGATAVFDKSDSAPLLEWLAGQTKES